MNWHEKRINEKRSHAFWSDIGL